MARKEKKIIIRTDSSTEIGSGHVMRCLTLAEILKENNAQVVFLCREYFNDFTGYIERKGFSVIKLTSISRWPEGPGGIVFPINWQNYDWEWDAKISQNILSRDFKGFDWLIVDHYGLDWRWETAMRSYVNNIMVIDDLANRNHDCDLLLDQNFQKNLNRRYDSLVSSHCKTFLGPQYALLRLEILKAKDKVRERDGKIHHILIFMGGGDPTNETEKALKAIQLINHPEISVDVVLGGLFKNKEKIRKLCSAIPNCVCYCQVENMAELMLKADLAIGSSGTTSWERCYLGLPSIILVIADNQKDIAIALEEEGAVWNLGWCDQVTEEVLARTLENVLLKSEEVKKVGQNAFRIMGGPMRLKDGMPVVQEILGM